MANNYLEFRQKIVFILKFFEEYRKAEYNKYLKIIIIFSLLLLFSLISVYYGLLVALHLVVLGGILFYLGIIGIMLAVIIALFNYDTNKKFKLELKSNCLPAVLNLFGDITWENRFGKTGNSFIPNKTINASGLFVYDDNKFYIDDEFRGTHNGIRYTISEIRYLDNQYTIDEENAKFGGNFRGLIILFKISKKIKNRTIISTKNSTTQKNFILNRMRSLILFLPFLILLFLFIICGYNTLMERTITIGGRILTFIFLLPFILIPLLTISKLFFNIIKKLKQIEPLNKVTLKDYKFNEKFNVYSSDQIEARYVITPAFMERLYNLKTTFKAKKLKCSFFDDNFMIAIETKKDLFELGDLCHSLIDSKYHFKLYNDLNSILNMIDYFKLD